MPGLTCTLGCGFVAAMPQITVSAPSDVESLGARWRALEGEADVSFFQSWTWVGCEAARRFADPVLIEARTGGRTVGLALCNRRAGWVGDRLWLGESGDAALDSPFVEHNGPVVAAAGIEEPMLRAALARRGRRLVLSGVGESRASLARAIRGTVDMSAERPAPYVDFAVLRAAGQDHMASLSANARQQLRRSLRRYGPVEVRAADGLAEALTFLDGLAALHQATWNARGQPGAFAVPEFRRFHQALLARAIPRGEAELLHITAAGETVGYLYNFLWRGWVLAYQSGFAYPDGDAHRKPGITCHHLAIARHLAAGQAGYDFLAGAARYKTSLANRVRHLAWLELGPVWRPAALRGALRRLVA